ncbi:MAG: hypothetical protein JWL70_3040 [Acidimicrobiia bacterium]|nr:hypothetical protein [Acidimicrobiia bacterium]
MSGGESRKPCSVLSRGHPESSIAVAVDSLPAMADTCSHLDTVSDVAPSSTGCEDCLRTGDRWVHLRMCLACGHIGCCDSSPNHHATAHYNAHPDHPLVRSYEPGEDWWWCYADDLFFEVPGAPPSPSHP